MERLSQMEQCEKAFQNWLENLTRLEETFNRYVYTNPEVNQSDFRQHRAWLMRAISDGELIAWDFESIRDQDGSPQYIELIDAKIATLFKTLLEWHLPADFTDPVPDSFKRGMKQAAEGKVMDFPGGEK